jgi:hypothetical protein
VFSMYMILYLAMNSGFFLPKTHLGQWSSIEEKKFKGEIAKNI